MKIRAELTFPKELKEEPIFYEIIELFGYLAERGIAADRRR